jgi:hypothetical protein
MTCVFLAPSSLQPPQIKESLATSPLNNKLLLLNKLLLPKRMVFLAIRMTRMVCLAVNKLSLFARFLLHMSGYISVYVTPERGPDGRAHTDSHSTLQTTKKYATFTSSSPTQNLVPKFFFHAFAS